MFELTKYSTKIRINLENGIWVFDAQSATGKTRLSKLLKDLDALGEPVGSITYYDILRGDLTVESFLSREKYRVVLLDRYDMYSNLGHEAICACARRAIVLIACKQGYTGSRDDGVCFIETTADSINITA